MMVGKDYLNLFVRSINFIWYGGIVKGLELCGSIVVVCGILSFVFIL